MTRQRFEVLDDLASLFGETASPPPSFERFLNRRDRRRRHRTVARRVTGATVLAALVPLLTVATRAGREPDAAVSPWGTTTPPWEPRPIEWTRFNASVEAGFLDVPVDYDNPDDGEMRIYVTRRIASDPAARIGTLVVLQGGPGFGGSDFANFATEIFDPAVLDAFDVIGFDPRGTGSSQPTIDCIDDYDHFYTGTDITPDDDAERRLLVDLAEELADGCAERNAEILQFVGTNSVAGDIDSLRRALGEDELSVLGFGYGSELGAVWATMFPTTVRAAVFDGAADPDADGQQLVQQQLASFEGMLTAYLAQCSADPGCSFNNGGDAEGAFDELMRQLDAAPIPSVEGRPEVTRGVALIAVTQAMYAEAMWPDLSDALADAQRGDGAGLLAFYDGYFGYNGDGTWGNAMEAFLTISCMDTAERPSVDVDDAFASTLSDAAPRISPHTTGGYYCTFFPQPIDPRVEITAAGAGPIVVCGTTGNVSTPLQGTEAMADALDDGRLIVVEGNSPNCWGVSQCADDLINSYLLDLAVPAENTRCPAD